MSRRGGLESVLGDPLHRNPRRTIREINNKNSLAAIFDQLNLQQYVLSGPGELPPYSTETRSDIIQSLFGAALIAHKGDIQLCRESIPLQLKNKFDLTIKKLFSTPVREIKDPKTNLQEICQIIGIDISYAPLPLGDNFKKYRKEQYKAQIEFNSPILKDKLIFFNSDILDSTRKGAEQILAAQALEILNAINNKLVLPKFKGLSEDTIKRLAIFFLLHEFETVKSKKIRSPEKWGDFGILALNLALEEKSTSFCKWLENICDISNYVFDDDLKNELRWLFKNQSRHRLKFSDHVLSKEISFIKELVLRGFLWSQPGQMRAALSTY